MFMTGNSRTEKKAKESNFKKGVVNIASFIGSTATMMKKLFIAKHRIPAAVPLNNPDLLRLIRLETQAAHLSNTITFHPSKINSAIINIKRSIQELEANKRNPAAIDFSKQYSARSHALDAEATERQAERDQLINKVKEFVRQQDHFSDEELKTLAKGGRSKEEMKSLVEKSDKARSDLMKQIDKLFAGETLLQTKLTTLEHEATHSAKVSGVPISKPSEPPTPQ
jgi:hypothetical protein